jgi:YebC/PmpR family DNA-binding regulatory protein
MGSQWKAKHRAAAADAKGKLFGKLCKEITIAARSGADPESNSKLRLLVEQARKASMPRETLERAIKKSSEKGDATNYESLTYEGFTPHRVPLIVEALTDNVNRTVSEVRVLFRKGQLCEKGSVAWEFDYVGIIEADGTSDPEEAAIEAGAQDCEKGEEAVTFYTEPTDLDLVCKALPNHGYTVQSAKLGYRPKNPVTLGEAELGDVEAFLAALDNHDDVQNIYVALG